MADDKPDTKNITISMNKICVYTCITGGYDRLLTPYETNDNIDYICFTDDPDIEHSNIWQIKPIPEELRYLTDVKKQRIVKICPHRYLKEYDISIWIDANIYIKKNFFEILDKLNFKETSMYARRHPFRTCLYDEAKICLMTNKDKIQNIQKQLIRYQKEGFPSNYGLSETNILFRRHNDLRYQLMANLWATELLNGSHRDQLSFTYACWKSDYSWKILNDSIYFKYFKRLLHSKMPQKYKNILYPSSKDKYAFVIINYNTPELVTVLIQSIRKNIKSIDYDILIMDNSDTCRYKIQDESIKFINNSKGFFIDFNIILQMYSTVKTKNNNASFKHSYTIQWLLDKLNYSNAIFFDSDVIIKKDIDFIDEDCITIADMQRHGEMDERKNIIYNSKTRFLPYLQYFNLKQIRENNIRFFDPVRMHGGNNIKNSNIYDTGASFTEDILSSSGLKYKVINYHDYASHLGNGSWKAQNIQKFIDENKEYL